MILGLVIFMEAYLGISAYGILSEDWPVKKFLSCYPNSAERPAVAALWGSFGTSTKGLVEFTRKFSDRAHLIEIHISNECARRSHRSGRQILPRLSTKVYQAAIENGTAKKAVQRRVKKIIETLDPVVNENTHLWLSTGLEHNLDAAAAKKLYRWVTQAAPVAEKIVDNPMTGVNTGLFSETHGRKAMGDVWNLDGVSINFKDGEDFFDRMYPQTVVAIGEMSQHKAIFLWSASQQGLRGIDGWNHGRSYTERQWVFTPKACRGMMMLLKNMEK